MITFAGVITLTGVITFTPKVLLTLVSITGRLVIIRTDSVAAGTQITFTGVITFTPKSC